MSSAVTPNVSQSIFRNKGAGFGGGPTLTGALGGGVFDGPFASGDLAGAAAGGDGFLLFWLLIKDRKTAELKCERQPGRVFF